MEWRGRSHEHGLKGLQRWHIGSYSSGGEGGGGGEEGRGGERRGDEVKEVMVTMAVTDIMLMMVWQCSCGEWGDSDD